MCFSNPCSLFCSCGAIPFAACLHGMELQLGLSLPTQPYPPKGLDLNKKRSFSQLFEQNTEALIPTLPLLPLTPDHPNDDDDPEDYHSNSSIITKNDGDDLVGWPSMNACWKKQRHESYGVGAAAGNDRTVETNHRCGSCGIGRPNTLYVKVKMEGDGIARKVDLCMHHSFQTLKETLKDMFGKYHQHSNCYKLVYQDKEGDWLLAEDVPWRSFIHCAQRLKLLKA